MRLNLKKKKVTKKQFKKAVGVLSNYLEQNGVNNLDKNNYFDIIKESVMTDAVFYAEGAIKEGDEKLLIEQMDLSNKYMTAYQWFSTQYKKGKLY